MRFLEYGEDPRLSRVNFAREWYQLNVNLARSVINASAQYYVMRFGLERLMVDLGQSTEKEHYAGDITEIDDLLKSFEVLEAAGLSDQERLVQTGKMKKIFEKIVCIADGYCIGDQIINEYYHKHGMATIEGIYPSGEVLLHYSKGAKIEYRKFNERWASTGEGTCVEDLYCVGEKVIVEPKDALATITGIYIPEREIAIRHGDGTTAVHKWSSDVIAVTRKGTCATDNYCIGDRVVTNTYSDTGAATIVGAYPTGKVAIEYDEKTRWPYYTWSVDRLGLMREGTCAADNYCVGNKVINKYYDYSDNGPATIVGVYPSGAVALRYSNGDRSQSTWAIKDLAIGTEGTCAADNYCVGHRVIRSSSGYLANILGVYPSGEVLLQSSDGEVNDNSWSISGLSRVELSPGNEGRCVFDNYCIGDQVAVHRYSHKHGLATIVGIYPSGKVAIQYSDGTASDYAWSVSHLAITKAETCAADNYCVGSKVVNQHYDDYGPAMIVGVYLTGKVEIVYDDGTTTEYAWSVDNLAVTEGEL